MAAASPGMSAGPLLPSPPRANRRLPGRPAARGAEAYILAFGAGKRVKLWGSGHMAYPRAEFTIGHRADI